MKALVDGDLVIGKATGSIDGATIPSALIDLPTDQLRFVGGEIVNIQGINQFYIDEKGRKHVVNSGGWQPLSCSFSAKLVLEPGGWRVRTPSELISKQIKEECSRRIFATASANSQMNMTAAAAAGMMISPQDQAAYVAALGWVASMRAACGALISSADADFRQDSKWPDIPEGVSELVAKY
jgi:hypothetical protein